MSEVQAPSGLTRRRPTTLVFVLVVPWLFATVATWTNNPEPWEIAVWVVLTIGMIVGALILRRDWNK